MIHDLEPKPATSEFASTLHRENIRLTEELARVKAQRARLRDQVRMERDFLRDEAIERTSACLERGDLVWE